MGKFFAVIVTFLVSTSISFAEERNAASYLAELSQLNQSTFVELGQFIIDYKDTARIVTVSGGGLAASYYIFLGSGYSEIPEVTLGVTDFDMSGDFNLGDGLLIVSFDDKLGFEYVEEGIVSLSFEDLAELRTALERVAENSQVVADIGELNDSFDRINHMMEDASSMYDSIQ